MYTHPLCFVAALAVVRSRPMCACSLVRLRDTAFTLSRVGDRVSCLTGMQLHWDVAL